MTHAHENAGREAGVFIEAEESEAPECGGDAAALVPDTEAGGTAGGSESGSSGCRTPEPRWRPAAEPTCCGSDCDDCPF